MLKIGKTLGVGTALRQPVVMEKPRPFDVDVAVAEGGCRRGSQGRVFTTGTRRSEFCDSVV